MEIQITSSTPTTQSSANVLSERAKIIKLIFVNTLTFLHAFLLIPSVIYLFRKAYLESLICAFFAANLDWLDGFLARKWKVVTDFGKFADPIADKVYFLGMLIALYAHIHIAVIAVVCLLEVSLVAHRVWILARKHKADVSSNFFGKFKAILQNIVVCSLLLGLYVELYDVQLRVIIIEYASLPLLYYTVPWATLSLIGHVRKHK